jgi:two-component system CheB/CheR fusion protein
MRAMAERVHDDELRASDVPLDPAPEDVRRVIDELREANDELDQAHRELEAADRELETMAEELDTLGERLETANEEVRTANEEARRLARRVDDAERRLRAILAALRPAVVVVDRDLRVQVWSRRAEERWRLREDEARGRVLVELPASVPMTALGDPLRRALEGAAAAELAIEGVGGPDARCLVRIAPLRAGGAVVGAVLTIEDPPGASAAA